MGGRIVMAVGIFFGTIVALALCIAWAQFWGEIGNYAGWTIAPAAGGIIGAVLAIAYLIGLLE